MLSKKSQKVIAMTLLSVTLFATSAQTVFAKSSITTTNNIAEKTSKKAKSYDLISLENELVEFLNTNITDGDYNISKIIDKFYKSKDEEKLISMIKDIKENKTDKSRKYKLTDGSQIRFYNNGTFSVSDAPIINSKISKEINQIKASAVSNWDTGRYTISETHYGWFGVKLYTVTSEGRFIFSNGTLSAYSYGGDVIKHFAGGFFTISEKECDKHVEPVIYPTYNGEFYTKCKVSLGLTIKGMGYETSDLVKGYAYAIVNISTGQSALGSDLEIIS